MTMLEMQVAVKLEHAVCTGDISMNFVVLHGKALLKSWEYVVSREVSRSLTVSVTTRTVDARARVVTACHSASG